MTEPCAFGCYVHHAAANVEFHMEVSDADALELAFTLIVDGKTVGSIFHEDDTFYAGTDMTGIGADMRDVGVPIFDY